MEQIIDHEDTEHLNEDKPNDSNGPTFPLHNLLPRKVVDNEKYLNVKLVNLSMVNSVGAPPFTTKTVNTYTFNIKLSPKMPIIGVKNLLKRHFRDSILLDNVKIFLIDPGNKNRFVRDIQDTEYLYNLPWLHEDSSFLAPLHQVKSANQLKASISQNLIDSSDTSYLVFIGYRLEFLENTNAGKYALNNYSVALPKVRRASEKTERNPTFPDSKHVSRRFLLNRLNAPPSILLVSQKRSRQARMMSQTSQLQNTNFISNNARRQSQAPAKVTASNEYYVPSNGKCLTEDYGKRLKKHLLYLRTNLDINSRVANLDDIGLYYQWDSFLLKPKSSAGSSSQDLRSNMDPSFGYGGANWAVETFTYNIQAPASLDEKWQSLEQLCNDRFGALKIK